MFALIGFIFVLHGFLAIRQIRFINDQPNTKATAYANARTWVVFLSFSLDIALVILWDLSGLLEAIHNPVGLITSLILFRFLIRWLFLGNVQRAVEKRFGFSNSSLGLFIRDGLKTLVLQALAVIPLVWFTLETLPVDPLMQIIWIWAIWLVLNIFTMVFKPSLTTWLFHSTASIKTGALQERVNRLAARVGLKTLKLIVLDGSKRSSHANARMEGVGPFKRVVMLDTLLHTLEEDEIETVVAHELGHFRLKHIPLYLILKGGLALIGILGFYYFMQAQIAYLALLAPIIASLALPILNSFIKKCEFQADKFAAKHTDAYIFCQALDKIDRQNNALETSDPIYAAFYQGHPMARTRKRRLKNGSAKAHMA